MQVLQTLMLPLSLKHKKKLMDVVSFECNVAVISLKVA